MNTNGINVYAKQVRDDAPMMIPDFRDDTPNVDAVASNPPLNLPGLGRINGLGIHFFFQFGNTIPFRF